MVTRASRFGVRTVEEKAAILTKAQAAKAANAAARKASPLRQDFADAPVWDDLARDMDLRLPPWGKAPTVNNMRTWLHKTGWSQAQAEEWLGCKLSQLPILNGLWPLRAFAGLVLEQQAEMTA